MPSEQQGTFRLKRSWAVNSRPLNWSGFNWSVATFFSDEVKWCHYLYIHHTRTMTGCVSVCVCMLEENRKLIICVCLFMNPLYFGSSILASHACACTCIRVCMTNHCMIYFIFLWCCRLGLSVCHAYEQRSLSNWSGPLKAPCHMEPSSLGCLSVHPSISYNCPQPGLYVVTIYCLVSP